MKTTSLIGKKVKVTLADGTTVKAKVTKAESSGVITEVETKDGEKIPTIDKVVNFVSKFSQILSQILMFLQLIKGTSAQKTLIGKIIVKRNSGKA